MPISIARSAIAIGDRFESDGRRRTVWTVEAVTKVPRQGTLVRLAELDGMGRITVPAIDLDILGEFRSMKLYGVDATP